MKKTAGSGRHGLLPQERLQRLVEAVISVSEELDPEAVLHRVVEAACALVQAKYAALGLIGADKALKRFVTVGFDAETVEALGELPVGRGVLSMLLREPHRVRPSDLGQNPAGANFPSEHPAMESFIGVPVRVRDAVFGNLYVTAKVDGTDFTPEDEQWVFALATAAGIAIENATLFEDGRRRRKWLEACAELARDVLDPSLEEENEGEEFVVNFAVQRAKEASGASMTALGLPMDQPGRLVCVAAAGENGPSFVGRSGIIRPSFLAQIRVPGESIVMGSGNDVVFADTPADETRRSGFAWTMVTPLGMPMDGNHGLLVSLRRAGEDEFSAVDVEMSATFGALVALALELRRSNRARQQEAIFGDRERIARDLHDMVIQRIFAAGLTLQGLRRFTNDPAVLGRVKAVTEELDATIREVRDTIYSLRSLAHSPTTMRSRIRASVQAGTAGRPYTTSTQQSGPIDALDEVLGDNLIAVISEGLSNVARHARATAVEVTVTVTRDRVRLVIEDNGQGIPDVHPGSGMQNMARRAQLCGGRFSVKSSPDEGTRLLWSAPVPTIGGTVPRKQQNPE